MSFPRYEVRLKPDKWAQFTTDQIRDLILKKTGLPADTLDGLGRRSMIDALERAAREARA